MFVSGSCWFSWLLEIERRNKEPPLSKYQVVSGDTYVKIAKKLNVTTEQLKEWNPESVSENLKIKDYQHFEKVIN